MIFSLGMTDAHPSRTLLDVGTIIDDEPFLLIADKMSGGFEDSWRDAGSLGAIWDRSVPVFTTTTTHVETNTRCQSQRTKRCDLVGWRDMASGEPDDAFYLCRHPR